MLEKVVLDRVKRGCVVLYMDEKNEEQCGFVYERLGEDKFKVQMLNTRLKLMLNSQCKAIEKEIDGEQIISIVKVGVLHSFVRPENYKQ